MDEHHVFCSAECDAAQCAVTFEAPPQDLRWMSPLELPLNRFDVHVRDGAALDRRRCVRQAIPNELQCALVHGFGSVVVANHEKRRDRHAIARSECCTRRARIVLVCPHDFVDPMPQPAATEEVLCLGALPTWLSVRQTLFHHGYVHWEVLRRALWSRYNPSARAMQARD